ncbi:hypothetical protein PCH_Pc13g12310 [Penicillium rubens Wisconsin 54-1255]|uniref:Uncharacterized protein n=1 Tax=Penicillium rubens (strain ATCC 28089 / DSM 1075 / NRRL 1951 / Wisconsin 54-1255) TaxID=500485 RepID=B6H5A5_PENRW|nr:hypothetical protein PCH_Pc13g12310 [Penicillium rubens Wisconsin 54-1255]
MEGLIKHDGSRKLGPQRYRSPLSIEYLFLISILTTYYIHLGCTDDIMRILAISSTSTTGLSVDEELRLGQKLLIMKNKNRIEGLWPDDEYLTPMGNGAAEVTEEVVNCSVSRPEPFVAFVVRGQVANFFFSFVITIPIPRVILNYTVRMYGCFVHRALRYHSECFTLLSQIPSAFSAAPCLISALVDLPIRTHGGTRHLPSSPAGTSPGTGMTSTPSRISPFHSIGPSSTDGLPSGPRFNHEDTKLDCSYGRRKSLEHIALCRLA